MAVCHYHPDRRGIGVCVRCRVVICPACSTRLDGVNHCHACLKALGRDVPARGGNWLKTAAGAILVCSLASLVLFAVGLLLSGVLAPL